MKIYFACSIRGGRGDGVIYAELVEFLKEHATVLTEIFADQKLTAEGMSKPDGEIHRIDMAWVREADVIVAEVTNPSLGVGYEIAKAEEWGKPVIALFRPGAGARLSAMIAGSPQVRVLEYARVDDVLKAELLALLEQS
jgi:nucleoside 2-deoxyribosyltransferase